MTRAAGDFGTVVPESLGVSIDLGGIGGISAAQMSGIGYTVSVSESTTGGETTLSPGVAKVSPVTFTGLQGTAAKIHALDSWVRATMTGQSNERKSVTLVLRGGGGDTRLSVTLVDCMLLGAQAFSFAPDSDPRLTYGALTLQPLKVQVGTLVLNGAPASGGLSGPLAGADLLLRSVQVNVERGTTNSLKLRALAGGGVHIEMSPTTVGSDKFVSYVLGRTTVEPLVMTGIMQGNGTMLKDWINAPFVSGANAAEATSVETQILDQSQSVAGSLVYGGPFLTSVTLIGPEGAPNFASIDLTVTVNSVASPPE